MANSKLAVQTTERDHRQQKQAEKARNTKLNKAPGYIIQDIVHKSKTRRESTPTEKEVQDRSSRTVTVVRFPIGERRVDTGCAESAFERCSVDPKRRGGGDARGQELCGAKGLLLNRVPRVLGRRE